MARCTCFINGDRWKMLESMLPKPKCNPKEGRPKEDNREVPEVILWVAQTVPGASFYP